MGSRGGDGYREGIHGRGGGYYVGRRDEEYGYNRDGRGWGDWEREQERGRERRRSVASGRSGSRDYDYYGPSAYMEPPYRRAVSRERTELLTETERYYPPAPKRYPLESVPTTGSSGATRCFVERSSSNAGLSAGPRFSASSQRGSYDDYDRGRPSEAVYVYRDPPPGRSRRASFDAGRVGRYDGGHDWYFR
jgi:hypothetical protein